MGRVSQEELKQLAGVRGRVIGLSLKNDFDFILAEKGEEGLRKVEREMARLGYPLKYRGLEDFQWYDEKMNLILHVSQKVFDWDDEMMREMGRWTAKISFITRVMMRYFVSLERVIRELGKYWGRYHTTGRLVPEEMDEKRRHLTLVLKDFSPGYPAPCRYLEGYFYQIASYLVPQEKLEVRETGCAFRGGKEHRFRVTW